MEYILMMYLVLLCIIMIMIVITVDFRIVFYRPQTAQIIFRTISNKRTLLSQIMHPKHKILTLYIYFVEPHGIAHNPPPPFQYKLYT